jgi:hypothetical protein
VVGPIAGWLGIIAWVGSAVICIAWVGAMVIAAVGLIFMPVVGVGGIATVGAVVGPVTGTCAGLVAAGAAGAVGAAQAARRAVSKTNPNRRLMICLLGSTNKIGRVEITGPRISLPGISEFDSGLNDRPQG